MPSPTQPAALETARRHLRAGATDSALQELRAAASDPACAAALRDLHMTRGDLQSAAAVARAADDAVCRGFLHHLAGDFRRAAACCREALADDPADPRARLHLARAVHNLGEAQAALDLLEAVTREFPELAETWHALGHALRAAGRLDEACRAYGEALERAPGLRSSRLDLGITRFAMDDAAGALECFQALLARDPEDPEALVNAGVALHLIGRLDDARQHLQRALEQAPDHAEAHRCLGAVYNETGDEARAIHHLERAIALEPRDPEPYADLAEVHELSSALDLAEERVRHGLEQAPGHPRLELAAARMLRRRGRPADAWQRLQAVDPRTLPPRHAREFFHESGLVLDRLGRPAQALEAITAANRLAARNPRARAVDRNAFFARLERLEHWLERNSASGSPGPDSGADPGADLCFLVGFPRSGTTLVDTMLHAHPDVAGVEERPTLESVIRTLEQRSPGYPDCVDTLQDADVDHLRAEYRRALDRYRNPDPPARMTVDKLPLRMLDVPLIARLFPAARVLFLARHPCDVVLSNFFQQFEPTEAFVHCDTLEGTVRFYDAVMSLWPRLAPFAGERLITLRYEDLVDDPESELRALCKALGLAWREDLVDPQRRTAGRGRIRTTSYQQVTEPVYRRAAGRWRNYREALAPWLDALSPHARRMDYGMDSERE